MILNIWFAYIYVAIIDKSRINKATTISLGRDPFRVPTAGSAAPGATYGQGRPHSGLNTFMQPATLKAERQSTLVKN